MTPMFLELVNQALIDAAGARMTAAGARLAKAETDLATARVAAKDAEAASQVAISGLGKVSANDAELALEVAHRGLRIGAKVLDAAQTERELARDNVREAKAAAHIPVYLRGIELRLAAAKKADDAHAMLADAQREHTAATAILNQAAAAGTPHVSGSGAMLQPLQMNASFSSLYDFEASQWRDGFGWWGGLAKSGMLK